MDEPNEKVINENEVHTKINEESCLLDDSDITDNWLKSKFKIYKNLIVIGIAWIFQFTAYQSMANLQSSLNSSKGLGTASLSTIYVALVLSSLLLPPILIRRLGLKWTIVVSQATYTLFIASNIYPRFYTSIPSAVILGFGAAPLWTAKCTYLTETAGYYSRLSKETSEAVVNRFFGIFFAMFQTSQVWGNVISSTILKQGVNHTNSSINITYCGAKDCPGGEGSKIKRPDDVTIYTLCGIYVTSAIFAMILIMLFLNTYKRKDLKSSESSSFSILISTAKHMKHKYQILILPMTLWLGFEQGFLGADYTRSYVSCIKGVDFVGLTMISYGVVDALGSYIFGQLTKYTGRIPLIIFAAILHYGVLITLLIWKPNTEQIWVIYLMPILWGVCDSIWQTQINSFYGVIFNDRQEPAFSAFRLWESLGFAFAYAYSNYLCVSVKIYLLLGYLTLALLGYGTIEIMEKTKKKN